MASRMKTLFDSYESEVLGSRASRLEPNGRQSVGCLPAIDRAACQRSTVDQQSASALGSLSFLIRVCWRSRSERSRLFGFLPTLPGVPLCSLVGSLAQDWLDVRGQIRGACGGGYIFCEA